MQNQARMLMECKNAKIVKCCLKKLEKIKRNVKNDDFWPDLLVKNQFITCIFKVEDQRRLDHRATSDFYSHPLQ